MKMPALSFGSGGPLGWLSRHFEKLLALAVGGFAAVLTWWGIQAVMTESVKPERTPEKLSAKADEARRNIEAATKPPAERIPVVPPLAGQLDAWRQGQTELVPPSTSVLIDRPLFQELGKRTKPDVFAIEDLRAVAGIAVVPDAAAAAAGMEPMIQPRLPEAPLEDPRRPPGRPPRGGRRDGAERGGELSPFGPGEMPLGQPGQPMGPEPVVTPAPPGKITPFVVVTGLIPAAKQQEEFTRRFSSASLRDQQRDAPKWGDYRVERAVVVEGAAPQWKEMRNVVPEADPRAGGGVPGAELGPALATEGLPPTFLLQQTESEKNYVSPLPQRIDEAWGMLAMHPWFAPRLEVILEKGMGGAQDVGSQSLAEAVEAAGRLAGTDVAIADVVLEGEPETQAGLHAFRVRSADGKTVAKPGKIGEADGLVFVMTDAWWSRLVVNWDTEKSHPCNLVIHVERLGGTPVARIVELQLRDEDGAVSETLKDPNPQGFDPGGGGFAEGGLMPPGMPFGDGRAAGLLEPFRLFRFIDTDVKPGETYRYRVRFALRNPNVGLLPKHLADPKAASGAFLVSGYSNETTSVRVPEPMAFLARTIPREAARKLKVKDDVTEVLVLAPAKNGNFGLRSAVTGVGGLLDVDPALNKPGDVRFFGEPVQTDRVVVDLRGRQEDRGDLKEPAPPEPLDLLLLRDDGSFELVSAAESERRLDRYRTTLFPPGMDVPDDGRKREGERPR